MFSGGLLVIAVFVAVASLILMIAVLAFGGAKPAQATAGTTTANGFNSQATAAERKKRIKAAESKEDLVERIIQAGFYRKSTIITYQIIRYSLPIVPIIFAVIVWRLEIMSPAYALILGIASGALGTVIPSFWLDMKRRARQTALRRSLPDALDVIIICVEAGLSLPAALARVSRELASVHPLLAAELAICQREIQMGCSTGESLHRLAKRFDSEEVRGLASVITQAEKYGASIINAIRVHAETMRLKRFQSAEERASKAAVQLVFPTIVCIFPALFIVLAGPAVVRIFEMFEKMGL